MSRDEIYFTPGRLAQKLGISKPMVMRHLEQTGLIHACRRGHKGNLQIPYSIALRLAGGNEKTLAIPVRHPQTRRKPEKLTEGLFEASKNPSSLPKIKRPRGRPRKILPDGEDRFDYYRKIGDALAKLGITAQDLLKFYGLEVGKDEPQKTDNPS